MCAVEGASLAESRTRECVDRESSILCPSRRQDCVQTDISYVLSKRSTIHGGESSSKDGAEN